VFVNYAVKLKFAGMWIKMSIEAIKKAGKPHKYDPWCHCRRCLAYQKWYSEITSRNGK